MKGTWLWDGGSISPIYTIENFNNESGNKHNLLTSVSLVHLQSCQQEYTMAVVPTWDSLVRQSFQVQMAAQLAYL